MLIYIIYVYTCIHEHSTFDVHDNGTWEGVSMDNTSPSSIFIITCIYSYNYLS